MSFQPGYVHAAGNAGPGCPRQRRPLHSRPDGSPVHGGRVRLRDWSAGGRPTRQCQSSVVQVGGVDVFSINH